MRARDVATCLAVVALAIALRAPRVDADAPIDVEITGAPQLDAFWYLAAATKSGGEGIGAAYDRPLWTAIGRAWFAVFGQSVASAQGLGAAFSVLQVALVLGLAWRALGRGAGGSGALWLAVAYPFVALGRTGLIYGPIATLLALAAWLWIEALSADGRSRALVLGGAALIVAFATALFFKGVALVLLPALVVSFAATRERGPRYLAIGAAVTVAVAALILALDPGGTATRNLQRFSFYGIDLHEKGSLFGVLVRALMLGGQTAWLGRRPGDVSGRWIGSGMGSLSPIFFALATLGIALAWRDRDRLGPRARAALALCSAWAIAFVAASSLLEYRPARYFMLIAPPSAVLAGWAVARIGGWVELSPPKPWRAIDTAVLGAIAWIGATHFLALARDAIHVVQYADERANEDAALVLAGAALAYAIVLLERRAAARGTARAPVAIAAVALLAIGAVDVVRDVVAIRGPRTLAVANETVAAMLGRDAKLCGVYARSLTMDNGLAWGEPWAMGHDWRSVRQLFDKAREGRFTHFCLDNVQDDVVGFRRTLDESPLPFPLVAVLHVRGLNVFVYRFPRVERTGYRLSDFERGRNEDERGNAGLAEKAYGRLGTQLVAARLRTLLFLGHIPAAYEAARIAATRGGLDLDDPELRDLMELLAPGK